MYTYTYIIHMYVSGSVVPGAHEPPKAAKERVSAHSSTATSYVPGRTSLNGSLKRHL